MRVDLMVGSRTSALIAVALIALPPVLAAQTPGDIAQAKFLCDWRADKHPESPPLPAGFCDLSRGESLFSDSQHWWVQWFETAGDAEVKAQGEFWEAWRNTDEARAFAIQDEQERATVKAKQERERAAARAKQEKKRAAAVSQAKPPSSHADTGDSTDALIVLSEVGFLTGAADGCNVASRESNILSSGMALAIGRGRYGDPSQAHILLNNARQRGVSEAAAGNLDCTKIADSIAPFLREGVN